LSVTFISLGLTKAVGVYDWIGVAAKSASTAFRLYIVSAEYISRDVADLEL